MEDRYDVVIVGAGPAGASTALHLLARRPSARVALVDRQSHPRIKPCGGAISRWGLEVLEALGLGLDALGVAHVPIGAIAVRAPKSTGVHVNPSNAAPLGAVVRRDRFDAALAARAVAAGASLIAPAALRSLRVGDEVAVEVVGREGARTLGGALLVGADGTGSAVRRLGGFAEAGRRAQLVVTETRPTPADERLWLGGARGMIDFDLRVLAPTAGAPPLAGYAWDFATQLDGVPAVSRGLFAYAPTAGGPSLDARLRGRLVALGLDPDASRILPYSERIFHGMPSHVATARVLLVGEAAGLVDAVTGEGIAQALASGRLAAAHLDRALGERAARGSAPLEPGRYAEELAALRLGRHLRQMARMAPLAYGPNGATLADALAAAPAAMEAGARWYAGERLGWPRKLDVGLRYASSVARDLTFAHTRH
jgi:flavin-dependent dehydrogenase